MAGGENRDIAGISVVIVFFQENSIQKNLLGQILRFWPLIL